MCSQEAATDMKEMVILGKTQNQDDRKKDPAPEKKPRTLGPEMSSQKPRRLFPDSDDEDGDGANTPNNAEASSEENAEDKSEDEDLFTGQFLAIKNTAEAPTTPAPSKASPTSATLSARDKMPDEKKALALEDQPPSLDNVTGKISEELLGCMPAWISQHFDCNSLDCRATLVCGFLFSVLRTF